MSRFLTEAELVQYTGRHWKSKQIATLKKIGIAFIVNACGKPVVTVAAVEGRKEVPVAKQWEPTRGQTTNCK
jgi:hypothetical protein